MKCLLLPLIAAITLPTAVNAFPFGNNVQIENNVGEKILIKGKTVLTKDFYKKDLITLIEKNLNQLENYTFYEEMENKYKIDYEYCDSFPFKCYGTMNKFYEESLDKYYELNIKHKKEILNYKNYKKALVHDKSDMGIKHKISVDFTPVYIDLNNVKTVGKTEKIYCFNPLLNEKFKQIWIKESKKGQFNFRMEFIKKKYAKF